ncbi:MAG: hypothetical protein AAF363_17800 [Bacteroidota bacterium]
MMPNDEKENEKNDESLEGKLEDLWKDRDEKEIKESRLNSDPKEEKATERNLKELAKKYFSDRDDLNLGSR